MTKDEYKEASEYWVNADSTSVKMERDTIIDKFNEFISEHNTCALATSCGGFVRCTPLEYTYMNNCFWFLSEGGLKFKALAENSNVCLAIFDGFCGFGNIAGMQISGTAEIIEAWSQQYTELLEFKCLNSDAMKKFDNALHLIKVTPSKIEMFNSAFRKDGFGIRQSVEL